MVDANECDVVVVGTGAAGFAAAVMAARNGAEVVMLEAAPEVGGTTYRSSGGYWIPNNHVQRSRGVTMERDSVLKHMAFLGYPATFDETDERLGLTELQYELISTFYDRAASIIEELESTGVLTSIQMDYPGREDGMPPYFETPYDATAGAVLGCQVTEFGSDTASNPNADTMRKLGGRQGDGADLIASFAAAAAELGVEVRVSHRVTRILQNDSGDVIGVVADHPAGQVTVHTRQGVVFATGGFSHNPELAAKYLRGPIVGSCSVATAQGDFVTMGLEVGAELGNMAEGWWAELPLELVKEMRSQPDLMSFIQGASVILVDANGRRVVNEKTQYNERAKVHFKRAEDGSYPNRFLFQIFDQAHLESEPWPARWPVPADGSVAPYMIAGDTPQELESRIQERLDSLADEVDDFTLNDGFGRNLEETIRRFNEFARSGVDADFGRGDAVSERHYEAPARPGLVNNTMAPFAESGPYYAIIVGASTLDTKGGPVIDAQGRVLRPDGTPIAGLYGAGNCIASPAGEAYWGGGSTLGPAIVFGYLAGVSVGSRDRLDVTAQLA